jgi:predicted cobalt transporter CbtA
MLRNLILSAAAAGLAAGLLTATLQHVTTTPIILEAERYEKSAGPAHDHSYLPVEVTVATHGQEESWSPADGLERTLYTSLATVVLGIGFSLTLLAVMVLSGPTDRRGAPDWHSASPALQRWRLRRRWACRRKCREQRGRPWR